MTMLTVKREKRKHLARLCTTLDLVNEDIIELDPRGDDASIPLSDLATVCTVPEVGRIPQLVCLDGVPAPCTLQCRAPYSQSIANNTALGRAEDVRISAEVEDEGAKEEESRGESVRKPESNVFLGISHSNLTDLLNKVKVRVTSISKGQCHIQGLQR